MPKLLSHKTQKKKKVCCGLKSQEALRPIGVARPMAMILTSTRETKSEGKKKIWAAIGHLFLGVLRRRQGYGVQVSSARGKQRGRQREKEDDMGGKAISS